MFLTVGRLGALGATCKTVSSNTYSKAVTNKWTRLKDGVDSPYYNGACKCYMPGYKPDQGVLMGLRGVYGVPPSSGSELWEGNPWSVCVVEVTANPPACPKCPTCAKCPTCPTCPKCPTCAAAPPCPPAEPCPQCDDCAAAAGLAKPRHDAYGPTLGILLAVAILGGGGYYAWKKLKKKKR